MTDKTDLLPCPFCGRDGKLLEDADHHGGFFYLGCAVGLDALEDKCKGANLFYTAPIEEKDEAVRQWNTRSDLVTSPESARGDYQSRVNDWIQACFGAEISADITERNHRFLEEALELVQSKGCTASEAHQLVDYVFNRPVGEPTQETGGVMVTLAALCLASDMDMITCGEAELERIWTKVEKIRAKQAAKPKHSPLPDQQKTVDAGELERAIGIVDGDNNHDLGKDLISKETHAEYRLVIDAARAHLTAISTDNAKRGK